MSDPRRRLSPDRARSRPWIRLACCVLAVFLTPPPFLARPQAQGLPGEFSGETTVTVVEVPVQVLVDGEPVRGLGAEDFVVYDEGERRQVTFFEVVDLEEAALWREAGEETEVPAAARRHFLLFFDLAFTPARFLGKAQQAALSLVREGLEPTDLVGVAFFHGRSGKSSVIGFTSDRGEVVEALEALGRLVGTEGEKGGGDADRRAEERRAGDRLGLTYGGWNVGGAEIGGWVDKERSLADEALEIVAGSGARASETLADMAAYSEQDVQQRRASRASALVDALRVTARQTRFIDGAKHLMLFSQGFESSLYTQEGHSWLYSDLEEAIEELRRAGWTVHGVDTGEVWADWRRRQKRESLALVAEATGGEVYVFAADPTQAVHRVVERTSVTYVLGFQTGEVPMDGSFRTLRVELVDGPEGARLHHRSGYFTPRPPAAREDETWRAEAGELILSADELDEIGMKVVAAPLELEERTARVPVLVELDGLGLAPPGIQGPQRTEIYVYAFGPGGRVEASESGLVLLDPAGLPDPSGGYKVLEEIDLPPGTHQVRVLVRNADSGRVALRVAEVTVPELQPSGQAMGAHLLPPIFVQEAGEPWVLVKVSRAGREGAEHPFRFGDTAFLPAAGATVALGASRTLFVMGYDLPEEGLDLQMRIVDPLGHPVPGGSAGLLERREGGAGDPDILALELRPDGLEPGVYAVQVALGAERRWTRATPFRVVD